MVTSGKLQGAFDEGGKGEKNVYSLSNVYEYLLHRYSNVAK